VVVVAETRSRDAAELAALRERIESEAETALDTGVEEIVFVPPRAVPKTSSGKIRRGACRELYLRGELGVERSIKRQLLTLGARTVVPLARRAAARVKTLSYAGWFWFCFAAATLAACLLANSLSGRAAWRVVAGVARGFFAAVARWSCSPRGPIDGSPACSRFIWAPF
jgi:hypothetical protein